jgi:ribosomal protein S18 acetylase RimI-like enzyme
MEIIQYDPTLLPDITVAYNDITRNVPHCYPVRSEDFEPVVAGVIHESEGHKRLHSEAAFVARDGRSIRGFIHIGVKRPENGGKTEEGVIRFLWYERGCRGVGQRLLDAATEYFQARDVKTITAFSQDYRYRFYHFDHAYLSDHLDHIQALLAFNGYRKAGGEIFLDWPNYYAVPTSSEIPAEFTFEWENGNGERPTGIVRAHQGGKEIGVCASVCGGEFSHMPEAQDWLFTTWLGVSDEFQGKGLGRYLLHRALQEMRGGGYRHASISTAWDNHRAFLFYSNYGYHVVDWTYGFRRELEEGEQ